MLVSHARNAAPTPVSSTVNTFISGQKFIFLVRAILEKPALRKQNKNITSGCSNSNHTCIILGGNKSLVEPA